MALEFHMLIVPVGSRLAGINPANIEYKYETPYKNECLWGHTRIIKVKGKKLLPNSPNTSEKIENNPDAEKAEPSRNALIKTIKKAVKIIVAILIKYFFIEFLFSPL